MSSLRQVSGYFDLQGLEGDFPTEIYNLESSTKHNLYKTGAVYFYSNEIEEEGTLDNLSRIEGVGNLIIGVAGFYTLDLVTIRKNVTHIIIIDLSQPTKIFWENMAFLIANSTSRNDCIAKIADNVTSNWDIYCPGISESLIGRYLFSIVASTRWLQKDDTYKRIKQIFVNRHFAFFSGDLCDTVACKNIHKIIKDHDLRVDSIYLSNVAEFIFPSQYLQYRDSLEELTSDLTIIVDTKERPFLLTENLAYSYVLNCFFLGRCVTNEERYFTNRHSILKRQVRQRNTTPISNLYPIIAFTERVFSNEETMSKFFYYDYGIFRNYYTDDSMKLKQAKIVERLISETGGQGTIAVKRLEEIAVPILYENSDLPTLQSSDAENTVAVEKGEEAEKLMVQVEEPSVEHRSLSSRHYNAGKIRRKRWKKREGSYSIFAHFAIKGS